MNKYFWIVAALLGLSLAAAAQPKAIGIRGGPFEQEISYEHWYTVFDNEFDFLEAEVGVFTGNGYKATLTYNFTLATPDFTDRGEWGLYAGPGVMTGYGSYTDPEGKSHGRPFIGGAFQLGVEYNFWVPLQLSADFRPAFIVPMKVNPYWYGFAIAARFAF